MLILKTYPLFFLYSYVTGPPVFYLAMLLSLWLVSFTQYNVLRFIHAVYQEMLPFSLLSSTPWYGRSEVRVAICLLKDI